MALLAVYPLNGDVKDYSGNGHNGVNNGVSFVAGKINQAGDFEASEGDTIVITHSAFSGTKFSFSGWINPESDSAFQRIIETNSSEFNITSSTTNWTDIRNNQFFGAGAFIYTTTDIPLGSWTHIAITVDLTITSNNVKVYVNGVLDTTHSKTLTSPYSFTVTTLGGFATRYYDGLQDEIRLYDHVLTQAEVTALFSVSDTGGLGVYDANLDGFVINNAPSANQYAGVMDTVKRTSAGYLRDLHDSHLHLSGKRGAYGANWGSVSLPANPLMTRSVIRINVDAANEMRLYSYNNISDGWFFVSLTGAISVTTTVVEITGTGAGTAIDYGSNSARTKHTMQITGNTNTGTFTSCTVNFEVSMDGTNYDIQFTLALTAAGGETFDIEIPAVKVRYNVTEVSVSGDADLDIAITSI